MAPRIPLDTELLDEYGVGDATGLTPSYSAARDRMLAAMHGLDRVDPVTHELCRLRNAHLQQCQVCMRFRYTDTDEGLLAAAQQYESSEVLTTRQKLALSLTDIYLRAPAEPTAGLREELLRGFPRRSSSNSSSARCGTPGTRRWWRWRSMESRSWSRQQRAEPPSSSAG